MSTKVDAKRFWEKRLTDEHSLKGVGYSALGRGFNFWMYVVRKATFQTLIKRFFPKHYSSVVLDVGVGTGFYTKQLLRKGHRVTGVDISGPTIKRLRTIFPQAVFLEGTVHEVHGCFDAVVAQDVLFHILDDEEYALTFKKIWSLLQPGGIFIFTENFPKERVAHAHHISREDSYIEHLLHENGFKLLLRRSQFCLMNQPVRKGDTLWWKWLTAVLIRAPLTGWIIGAVLAPLELILVQFGFGSSTDIVVLQKPNTHVL